MTTSSRYHRRNSHRTNSKNGANAIRFPRARRELQTEFDVSEADLDAIDEEVEDEVADAVEFALDSLLPDPDVALENVFAEGGSA